MVFFLNVLFLEFVSVFKNILNILAGVFFKIKCTGQNYEKETCQENI